MLLLSACAQSHTVRRAPDGDPIEAAKALSGAPEVVSASEPENGCGVFILNQGDDGPPPEAIECLSAAASSGEPAELAWSFPTTEGDPIVSFAFTEGSGVVVYTTNAFDSYGGEPQWQRTSCEAITATSLTGCPAR